MKPDRFNTLLQPLSRALAAQGARWAVLAAGLLLAWAGLPAVRAQQQFQGVCARVKIVILQELTLERMGFEAKLEITNNDGEDPITDFFADLTFENPVLSTNGVVNDASTLFFVRAPELENVSDVRGTGVIGPTRTAVIRWFIIPKISAGGTDPNGIRYRVGVNLAGKLRGLQIPDDLLFAIPDTIYVKPEPQLEITYFQPRDVQGDDPFTPQVESPIPFTLGVLVKNAGHGAARSVKIDSQQPKIVENKNNLLLIAQLLGARVMDSPLNQASLVVNLGDILPGEARKGAWDMITSLSGEFVEFKASYTHSSELGGEETSVITSLQAHFIAREVLNDQPGRDGITDFLADTDRDADHIPDALYESEGNILPVNFLALAEIANRNGDQVQIHLPADREGWGYLRLDDPGQNRLRISSVTRSDGKTIHPRNYWTNTRYSRIGNVRSDYLNIFDLVGLKTYEYTLIYDTSGSDTNPPVTTLHFSGTASEVNGKHFVLPETQLYFISEDASPVSIYYSVTNRPFAPAYPFRLTAPGEYGIEFYAEDTSGNREQTQSATVVVMGAQGPALATLDVSRSLIYVGAGPGSVRPRQTVVRYSAEPSAVPVAAIVEIYRGVKGFVQVGGVPSSPTSADSANLALNGEHLDFYRYRLDGGAWSDERPVSEPIALSGLSEGSHEVAILGRRSLGSYPAAEEASVIGWEVSSQAPATRISGAPPTPTRNRQAELVVGGAGVTDYRWRPAGSYFRPEQPVSASTTLSELARGPHVIEVIGKINGQWQAETQPTTIRWEVDPEFGGNMSGLDFVRRDRLENIGTVLQEFTWDGRDAQGVLLGPGWYTIKVTLEDQLGKRTVNTRIVGIEDLAGGAQELAAVERGASKPSGRGAWVVWQDRSEGGWQIYAQNLNSVTQVERISQGSLSQENPHTDGKFAVWQGRQSNGNWDILLKELGIPGQGDAVTASPNVDEVNPVVEWPWVVYGGRPAGNTNAVVQLEAVNLKTGLRGLVWPGAGDQLQASVQGGRVVWQDHRDQGFGEIYFKDLETGEQRRLTTNTFGQYFPAIEREWVVWQDNRNLQVDLYGYDLSRRFEFRLTDSNENEARPYLDGGWILCQEDSLGVQAENLRLIHIESSGAVALTRSRSGIKKRPSLAGGQVIWEEELEGQVSLMRAELPVIQAVFENRNLVVVTSGMVEYQSDAYGLLRAWREAAGVEEITRYAALVPQVVTETVRFSNGTPVGPNFSLQAGMCVWVRFGASHVLELGSEGNRGVDLAPGVNVLSYSKFPGRYSSYRLMAQLGPSKVRAVRMLDSETGRWLVSEVIDERPVGYDFGIPRAAVVMIDMIDAVTDWRPQ